MNFKDVLPKKVNSGTRKDFENMGIIFGDSVDSMFCKAILPKGWVVESTDHGMWFDMMDEFGRKRASMFYKGAAYDYDAFLNAICRYRIFVEPIDGWKNENRNNQWVARVKDYNDEIIWESYPTLNEPDSKTNRSEWLKWYDDKDKLRIFAQVWLDSMYPHWKNPIAYW